jgi:hypothetical protein
MPITHVVEEGECIETIASMHGFFPDTLWDLDENAELRELRGSMNLLVPGDEVHVPDLTEQVFDVATEAKHRFKRKGVPSEFTITYKDAKDQPLANIPYTTIIDGEFGPKGKSDAKGTITFPVSPSAEHLILRLETDILWAKENEYSLSALQPIDTIKGVQARLESLGFYTGPVDGQTSALLRKGVTAFETKHQLKSSGDPKNQAFKDKLLAEYGC